MLKSPAVKLLGGEEWTRTDKITLATAVVALFVGIPAWIDQEKGKKELCESAAGFRKDSVHGSRCRFSYELDPETLSSAGLSHKTSLCDSQNTSRQNRDRDTFVGTVSSR
jgi:hypothetical protein